MSKNVLSKSSFIRGLQCHKSLYLYKKRYFLRDPLPPEQLARFKRGTEVGVLARQLFPGGINCSPPNPFQYSKSAIRTLGLIKTNTPAIYEAAFSYNGVLVALDILTQVNGKWHAYEVKSSLSVSETYLMDAALQYHVITGAGVELASFSIVYINKEYVRIGAIELDKLFVFEDVTQMVMAQQDFIAQEIEAQIEITSLEHSPAIGVGTQCHRPYPCDFQGHCHMNLPAGSLLNWRWLSLDERYELVRNKYFMAPDIPENYFIDRLQRVKWNAHLRNEPFIDVAAGKIQIGILAYPIIFLKAYYSRPAVPETDGGTPYQQIPIQLSVCEVSNNQADPVISHFYFASLPNALQTFRDIVNVFAQTESAILVYDDEWLKHLIEEPYKSCAWAGEKQIIDLAELVRLGYYYHPLTNGEMDMMQWPPSTLQIVPADKGAFSKDVLAGIEFTNLPDEQPVREAFAGKLAASGRHFLDMMRALLRQFHPVASL